MYIPFWFRMGTQRDRPRALIETQVRCYEIGHGDYKQTADGPDFSGYIDVGGAKK